MGNLKPWCGRFGALAMFAVTGITLVIGPSRPASAYPLQAMCANRTVDCTCPSSIPSLPGATFTLITTGDLGPPGQDNAVSTGPYCAQTNGPVTTNCPSGYKPVNLKGNFGNIPVCNFSYSEPPQPATPAAVATRNKINNGLLTSLGRGGRRRLVILHHLI
jgi:hypothetical protein